MFEQLHARPGHRMLKIGAATGINAAPLAELVAPHGTVVTSELDDDPAALARAGYPHVTVIYGDDTLGRPTAAPYERIVVTAEAFDVAGAWWEQLAPGGRGTNGRGLERVMPRP